jgi:hypothetical protein
VSSFNFNNERASRLLLQDQVPRRGPAHNDSDIVRRTGDFENAISANATGNNMRTGGQHVEQGGQQVSHRRLQ